MVVPFAKKYIFFDFDMKKSVYLFAPRFSCDVFKG